MTFTIITDLSAGALSRRLVMWKPHNGVPKGMPKFVAKLSDNVSKFRRVHVRLCSSIADFDCYGRSFITHNPPVMSAAELSFLKAYFHFRNIARKGGREGPITICSLKSVEPIQVFHACYQLIYKVGNVLHDCYWSQARDALNYGGDRDTLFLISRARNRINHYMLKQFFRYSIFTPSALGIYKKHLYVPFDEAWVSEYAVFGKAVELCNFVLSFREVIDLGLPSYVNAKVYSYTFDHKALELLHDIETNPGPEGFRLICDLDNCIVPRISFIHYVYNTIVLKLMHDIEKNPGPYSPGDKVLLTTRRDDCADESLCITETFEAVIVIVEDFAVYSDCLIYYQEYRDYNIFCVRYLGSLYKFLVFETSHIRTDRILLSTKMLCQGNIYQRRMFRESFCSYIDRLFLNELNDREDEIRALFLPEMDDTGIFNDIRKVKALSTIEANNDKLINALRDPLGISDIVVKGLSAVNDVTANLIGLTVETEKNIITYLDKLIKTVERFADDGVKVQAGFDINTLLPDILTGKYKDPIMLALISISVLIVCKVTDNTLVKALAASIGAALAFKSGACEGVHECVTHLVTYISINIHRILDYFGSDDVVEEESGDSVIRGLVDGLVTALLGVQYFKVFSSLKGSDDMITTFMKGIAPLRKAKESLTSFVDFLLDVLYRFIRFIGDKFNKGDWATFGMSYPKVGMLANEVNAFVEKLEKEVNYIDVSNFNELKRLQSELRHLKVEIPIHKDNLIYHNTIITLLKLLDPLAMNFARNNTGTGGFRTQPLAFMLAGKPGHGKSVAMDALCSDVAIAVAPENTVERLMRNYDDCVYNKQYESEFDEGYHGQFICRIDEFGQSVDVAGMPDGVAFFSIRAINTAPYILNMAHLDLKGNNSFISEIIAATTNLERYLFKSIHSVDALGRRYEYVFWVVLKAKYCTDATMKLPPKSRIKDAVKLAASGVEVDENGEITNAWNVDVWEFYFYDMIKNNNGDCGIISGVHSYQEVLDMLITQFKFLKDQGDRMRHLYSTRRNQAYEKRFSKKYTPQADDEHFSDCDTDDPEPIQNSVADQLGLNRETVKELTKGMSILEITGTKVWSLFRSKYLNPIKVTCESILSRLSNMICKNPVATSLVVLTAASAAWYFFRDSVKAESGKHRTKVKLVKRNAKVHAANKMIKRTINSVELEAPVLSSDVRNIIDKVRKANWFSFAIETEGDVKDLGYILFIYGRVGVTPKHFYDYCYTVIETDEYAKIVLTNVGNDKLKFSFFAKECLPEDPEEFSDRGISPSMSDSDGEPVEEDLWFWNFNRSMPRRKDISNHFRSMSDTVLSRPFGAAIVKPSTKNGPIEIIATTAKPIAGLDYNYVLNRGFILNFSTFAGMCGSLLFSIDNFDKMPKIVGMHVAGDKTTNGISVGLFKEYIEVVKDYFPPECDFDIDSVSSCPIELECGAFPEQFEFVRKSEHVLQELGRTELVKTELFGCIGPSPNMPAIMTKHRKGDVIVDPLLKAISKYGLPLPAISEGLLSSVCQAVFINMMAATYAKDEYVPCAVLTVDESIEGWYDLKGVNLNGAVGVHYHSLGYKKKRDMVGKPDGYDLSGPGYELLKKNVLEQIEDLKAARRVNWFCRIFPKDELLPKKKIIENDKLRSIWGNPFDMTIIERMYFGAFYAWVTRNRIVNDIAIGINTNSTEFDIVARKLTCFGRNLCIFGDFSNYDGTCRHLVLHLICVYIINPWYKLFMKHNVQDDEVRIRVIDHIGNSEVYFRGIILAIFNSMLSGIAGTATLNSFRNKVEAVYAAVIHKYGKRSLLNPPTISEIEWVMRSLSCIFYGDDNGIAVARQFEGFNQTSLSAIFAKMGYKYTSDLKDDSQHLLRDVSDGTFLKCAFHYDNKRYLWIAVLAFTSIMDMLYYRKKSCSVEDYKRNIRCAILHISRHGKKIFDNCVPEILARAYNEVGFMLDFPSDHKTCFDKSFDLKVEFI